jgi:hypothetical protein
LINWSRNTLRVASAKNMPSKESPAPTYINLTAAINEAGGVVGGALGGALGRGSGGSEGVGMATSSWSYVLLRSSGRPGLPNSISCGDVANPVV